MNTIYDNTQQDANNKYLNFVRKEAITLIKLVDNSESDYLYSKPVFHVVLKVFSISNNTADVHILLLKFRVT
jgi:hypothetical protein